MIRYIGVDLEDGLTIVEAIEIQGRGLQMKFVCLGSPSQLRGLLLSLARGDHTPNSAIPSGRCIGIWMLPASTPFVRR